MQDRDAVLDRHIDAGRVESLLQWADGRPDAGHEDRVVHVLTLTENASTIVKDIARRTGGVERAGLRISSDPALNSAFSVTATDHPEPGDQVVEQSGATVHLEPQAAGELDDKVLDAGVDQAGNVQFSLGQQV